MFWCKSLDGDVPGRVRIQNIFIDPIVSARKKAEKRDRHEKREKERKRRFGVNAIISLMMASDDGVDAETSLSLFLSLFMSISLLRLFSRAHYWVNKYILKMRVSSKELFLTLKGSHTV